MERQKIVHNKILDYAYSQELCVYKDSQIAIYKGHNILSSEPVLVKIVDIKHMKPEQLTQYINSLKSLKAIQHENISRMMDIVNTPANIFIMYQYHEINMHQILSQGKVSEQQAIQLFEQILAGILYLHNKNIPHRSITCSNIMMKQNKNGVLKIKITHPNQNQQLNQKHKDWFTSPQNMFKKVVGTKGDIWSLGVVYFYLLNGDNQTKSMDLEQFHKFVTSINTYKQMAGVSNWSKNILVRMLVIQPQKRADIHEIVQMMKSKGQTSAITYQPISHQQHSSETTLDLPLQDIKPSTGIIPTSPRQTEGLNQYHRSPLKYVNKSPIRRNQSFQTNAKSPIANHRQMPSQINMQLLNKICYYFDLALLIQRLVFVFNEAKTVYEQAVKITLLTLKHFSQIVKQISKLTQQNKSILSQQQIRLLKVFEQKISNYQLSNTKKMEHDIYFTHMLSIGKQSSFEFLNYIQFWLRLAIRHTIDFVQINRKNLIDRKYLQCIYWSYMNALKYYHLLDWLKVEKKPNKIPEFYIDKILNQRQEVSIELFKLTEESALKILRI